VLVLQKKILLFPKTKQKPTKNKTAMTLNTTIKRANHIQDKTATVPHTHTHTFTEHNHFNEICQLYAGRLPSKLLKFVAAVFLQNTNSH